MKKEIKLVCDECGNEIVKGSEYYDERNNGDCFLCTSCGNRYLLETEKGYYVTDEDYKYIDDNDKDNITPWYKKKYTNKI